MKILLLNTLTYYIIGTYENSYNKYEDLKS